jgi:putative hemolysin
VIFWNVLLLLFLILLNGALAMAEIAIISSRQIRLQQRMEDGDRRAQTALELIRSPSHFLSTVQIGITLIGILAGAVGGAQLAIPLAEWIGRVSWLYPYRQELALILVVMVITYLSLVLGELLPKRAAQLNPEEIAVRVAPWMQGLGKLTHPLVTLLGASTDFLLKLFGWQKALSPDLTEEEIKGIIEQGVESGVIEQRETDMIEGVLRLGDRLVSAFMTPRTDIDCIEVLYELVVFGY